MLNYVAAELYKLRKRKLLFVSMGILLLLETLVGGPGFWVEEIQDELWAGMTFLLFLLMSFGLFIAPIFAALVFDDQYGRGTLKNEIVYGIPRWTIYLGKLSAAALAGTVCAALAVAWYLLLCLMGNGGVLPPAQVWALLLNLVATAWLTWLAALSFAFLVLSVLRSTAGALVVVYLVSNICIPIGLTNYSGELGWLRLLAHWFYSAPYAQIWYDATNGAGLGSLPSLGFALLVGGGWVVVTTLLGLALFRRKEIR